MTDLFLRLPILAWGLLLASAGAVVAHPHVFAEARLDVAVNPDLTVKALKHLWRFDDTFSSTVLLEFDANADLKLDEKELQEVANTIYTSIAEYHYFQVVTAGGKDVAMKKPRELMVSFDNQQLVVMFESAPEKPLKLDGKVTFGVYDPTFYTAIDFLEDDLMAVDHMPAQCVRSVVRPDADDAIAQNQAQLDEAFFNDPTGNDLGKLLATRLELDCKATG